MTASELKGRYENYCQCIGEGGYFFDRKTMSFFGDRMANFGVRAAVIKTWEGEDIVELEVWELYRKRPVHGGLYGHCAYFRKDGKQIFNHE